MLYKLSISNIKKSFKDYAIYFVTLILGVCVFYLFNSMDSQTANIIITQNQSWMIDLLIDILSYVSVFVSLILGFLIIYASRFLIKKRNKEFGVYMTLGMSKRKISILLLIETFLIGLISLIIGLVLGVVLSQITSIFVANMFEADMSKYVFTFSKSAVIKTLIYFGIIYFVVMIFNVVIINKNKLINLLQASKKQEKIKIRNSFVCVILFIISVIMLVSAYYLVTGGLSYLTSKSIAIIGLPIGLGILGTLLFFYSVAGMFLKVISKCKRVYYKDLNTFIFKQISSKINTMVISISIICIMLFFTFCLLSSAFTIKEYYNSSINRLCPVDYEILFTTPNPESMLDHLKGSNYKDILVVHEYYDQNFTEIASLGEENYQRLKKEYPFLEIGNFSVEVMSLSEYNKLAKLFNIEKISLNKDEYAIVADYQTMVYQGTLDFNTNLNIFGYKLKPAYKDVIKGSNKISGNESNIGFFVVSDEIIDNYDSYNTIIYGNYNTTDKELKNKYEKELTTYINNNETSYAFDSKLQIKESADGLSTIVTFIGLYLGIIFLISSSAILSLKELSDCLDDKNKYRTLRQIGVEEKEINKSLFKQAFIFFIIPLILAIIHTIFGLKFCGFILSSIGIVNMNVGFIKTLLFLILIYGLYFIITYLSSKKIISEKN